MTETLELPTGDVVEPGDVLLHDGYPYRYRPLADDEYAFELVPLYWGDGGLDVPFRDRGALVDQWGPDSRGTLSSEEWTAWLRDARADDRFDDREVDALARELPVEVAAVEGERDGVLDRLRRALGR